MSDRPPDSLALLTRRLSELLASDEGTLVLAQLQKIGLLAAAERPAPAAAPRGRPRLGVWEPAGRTNGRRPFVRSVAHADEWRLWADVERIPAKQGRRVVLLGESVARGYLYDPALTPAAVLQAMLGGVEVVDLARSDITAGELESLLDAVPALGPDAVVLFAGNNCHNVLYSLADLGRLGEIVRREAYAGARQIVLREIIVPLWRLLLDRLAAAARGLPVVVVVPEFNLGDWRGEPSVLAPVLPEGRNAPWMVARAEAERALAGGEAARALTRAREMTALDGGASGMGYELAGRACLALGRVAEARAALEAARDAVCGTLIAHTPRCPAAIQAVLRAKAAEHGFAVVDLPRVFEAALGGALPDRRLFLDYCHLTVRGIELAMGAAAERLLPRLGRGAARRPRPLPRLSPADEATAHVLAAIHNAHHGQPAEVLRYHLACAVEASRAARAQLAWYLEAQACGNAPWLSRAFEPLAESALVRRYLTPTDPRVMDPLADVELIAAMSDVLAGGGPTPPRGGDARSVDLLAPRQRARTFRDRFGYSLGPPRGYHRALDLASSFFFERRTVGPLQARLTCRLPGADGGPAPVAVYLNGGLVDRLAVGATWRRFTLALPADGLREGVNELRIEWPLLAPPWAPLLEEGARRLERAQYPDVLPAYGEIHAFRLSDRDPSSPPRGT